LPTHLQLKSGDLVFVAAWEERKAPRSCAAFRKLLPLTGDLLQARWSGEAAWVSIDHLPLDAPMENHTAYPSRGDLLLYPGHVSVKEVLIPYGPTCFGSKMGTLAGNHFATIVRGLEHLEEMGRRVVWEGAQRIEFTEVTL
jgi:hypothetical protein